MVLLAPFLLCSKVLGSVRDWGSTRLVGLPSTDIRRMKGF